MEDFALEQAAKARRVFREIDKRAGRDGVYLLVDGQSLCQRSIAEKCQYQSSEKATQTAVKVRRSLWWTKPVDVRLQLGKCPSCAGRK